MKKAVFLGLILFACTDETTTQGSPADLSISIATDLFVTDVQVIEIPDITIDAWVNPCENIPNTHVRFCE